MRNRTKTKRTETKLPERVNITIIVSHPSDPQTKVKVTFDDALLEKVLDPRMGPVVAVARKFVQLFE